MISVVVPTYNELQNIENLVQKAGAALAATGEEFELIVVDDNSPDETAAEVRRLQANRPWLRLLVRENARDLSTAVVTGWRAARGDVVGCMDADLQHPPEMLLELIVRLRISGADMVVASRHVRGGGVTDWHFFRRVISWTATLLATVILPRTLTNVRDPMSGYFLMRRHVLDGVELKPMGYKILFEVLARGNYTRIDEVAFVFRERAEGASKLQASTVLKYLAHLIRISLETGEAVRMAKFALVGLSGVVVNFFCYRLLAGESGWVVPAAAAGSAAFATATNFIWNELFTFRETHKATPGWHYVVRRFLAFAGLSTTGLVINVGLVSLLVGYFGVPWLPGLMAGIGLAAPWNFAVNSNLTWGPWWDRKILSETAPVRNPSEATPEEAGVRLGRAGLL